MEGARGKKNTDGKRNRTATESTQNTNDLLTSIRSYVLFSYGSTISSRRHFECGAEGNVSIRLRGVGDTGYLRGRRSATGFLHEPFPFEGSLRAGSPGSLLFQSQDAGKRGPKRQVAYAPAATETVSGHY